MAADVFARAFDILDAAASFSEREGLGSMRVYVDNQDGFAVVEWTARGVRYSIRADSVDGSEGGE